MFKGQVCKVLAAGLAVIGLSLGSGFAQEEQHPPRFEVGGQFTLHRTGAFSISGVETAPGVGGRFVFNVHRYVSLESEINFLPREESFPESNFVGGNITQGFFGTKVGYRWRRFGLFGKFRPGFVSHGHASLGLASPPPPITFNFGRLTHFAMDAGGVAEFYPSRRWALRFDVGDTIIRNGQQEPPFTPFTIPTSYSHRLQVSAGVLFRFGKPAP